MSAKTAKAVETVKTVEAVATVQAVRTGRTVKTAENAVETAESAKTVRPVKVVGGCEASGCERQWTILTPRATPRFPGPPGGSPAVSPGVPLVGPPPPPLKG